MTSYALTQTFTPVLNTPDFLAIYGREDCQLPLDEQKLLRPVETVLFPKAKCKIIKAFANISQIETQEYTDGLLYVDSRFLQKVGEDAPERKKTLPSITYIIEGLKALIGTPYVWGGNWSAGIPEMFQYYPPKVNFLKLDDLTKRTWALQGVDCSGLIYQVTGGWTPRNTSQLITFGRAVHVAGLTLNQLAEELQPLDAIVWRGHVIFVLDHGTCIESLGGKGVVSFPLKERLNEILTSYKKRPVNDWNNTDGERFVVRRWHTQSS